MTPEERIAELQAELHKRDELMLGSLRMLRKTREDRGVAIISWLLIGLVIGLLAGRLL